MSFTLLRRARARRPIARAAGERAQNPTLVLGIILAGYLMTVLDLSVVIAALPQIHTSLHFSAAGLSWVQSAYAVTFGGLLLLGARAGDILGRRRVLVAGVGLFAAASLLAGLAQSAAMLLAARALQGVGAAIAAPSTLALLTVTFSEGASRTRALAYYSAVAGGGGSAGLVLGGLLTDLISWRWAMFVNVPVGLAIMVLAPRHLPETERRPGHFDVAGALTSTLGMTALVYGFVRAASDGWGDPTTLGAFATGVALIAAFLSVEVRAEQPITPLRLFASRERSGAYAARAFAVAGMFSTFFFMTQYLQAVRGYDALHAGLAFLPMTAVMFGVSRRVPQLARRFGDQRLLVGGLALALAGLAWMSRLEAGSAFFPHIAVALTLMGTGMGLALAPLTAAGIAGVAPEDAGAASGVVNVAQQLGGSLGLSVIVTVFAAADGGDLTHAIATALTGSAAFLALALATVTLVAGRPFARARAVAPAAAPPAA